MRFAKWLFIFILLLLLSNISAQTNIDAYKRCSVKTLNFEQGLLNNGTTNIITDENSFTWVSTATGMQRYNGYSLEQINPVIDKKVIEINSPVYFFGLQNGNIWISYKQGILEYSPLLNSFKKLVKLSSYKSSFSIVPLKETNEGIWCMQENKGIVVYSRSGVILRSLNNINSADINNIIRSADILFGNIISSDTNFIFIKKNENNILQINIYDNTSNNLSFNNGIIYSLGCAGNNLYVMSDKGLYCLRSNIFTPVINALNNKVFSEKINYSCIESSNNNNLLFSINRHLYEIDSSSGYPKEFTGFNREPIISTGGIQRIYADKFRRIWLLTNDDIKRVQNVNIPFEHFIYPNEKNNFVRSLYYDEQKHILIAGCYNGTIQLYDTLANPLLQKPLMNTDAGYILSIKKLTQNEYLLLTFNKGLYLLNLQTKKIIPYAEANQKQLSSFNFDNIIQPVNDSCFLCCTSKNVFKCVIKKGKIASAIPLLFLANNTGYITSFIFTSQKKLWTGTTDGFIYCLNEKNSTSTLHVPGNYVIRCFTETADNKIWIGTDKGLYVYSNNGKLLKTINRETGLLNDCIYALLPNETNSVFASTNLGLSYVNENGTIKNFAKELGLQENEFNTAAAIKTSAGKFYFGGVNGISAFYPADLSSIKDTPVLNITRFVVNDSAINATFDTIVLKYNQNRLQFDLAALGLLNNNEYLYKYRLTGFDENWQTTHQPTNIKYNLAPGNYVFEIACNPVLSSGSIFKKSITIIINAPWWQTWWFKILVAVTVIVIISLIIVQYNRKKYLEKIRALQMQQQMQQERERISRELHDNIGAQISFISSNIDWLIDDAAHLNKQQQMQQLSSINKTAKNVMSNLRESIWALNKEKITLEEFADKLKAYVQNIIRLKPGIEFIAEENIQDNIVLSPTETLNIFRICQECVNNVMKHAGATVLKITIASHKNKSYSILINDNGKGFKNTSLNGHYGLQNMAHRAKELNAALKFESSEGKGTTVFIHK